MFVTCRGCGQEFRDSKKAWHVCPKTATPAALDCRFLALSHNSADLHQIIHALKDVSRDEDIVYLRKEDVVRLLRDAIEDGSTTADNVSALADKLEGIKR